MKFNSCVLSFLFLWLAHTTVLAQQAEVLIPVGHHAPVRTLSASSDMRYLASGTDENDEKGIRKGATVKIWDISEQTELAQIQGFTSSITALQFSASGELLAMCDMHGKLLVWDVKNEMVIYELQAAPQTSQLYFTADEKFLYGIGTELRKWNLADGRLVQKVSLHQRRLEPSAYAPKQQLMAFTGQSKNFQTMGANGAIQELAGFSFSYQAMSFDPQGDLMMIGTDLLLSGDKRSSLKVFRFKDKSLKTLQTFDQQNANRILSPFHLFTYTDTSWQAQDLQSGKSTAHMYQGRLTALYPAMDGKTVFIAGVEATGKITLSQIDIEGDALPTHFSAHGVLPGRAYFSNKDSLIHIPLAGGEHAPARCLDFNLFSSAIYFHALLPEQSLSPSGKYRYENDSQQFALYEVKTNKRIGVIPSTTAIYRFSEDDKYLLTKGNDEDRTIRLWRTSDLKQLKTFLSISEINQLAFLKSGKTFITVSNDKTARLWDIEKNAILRTYRGHQTAVKEMTISPDEKLLATSDENNQLILWELESGKLLKQWAGHREKINTLKFSDQSHYLLSTGNDYAVKLWDLKDLSEKLAVYVVDSTEYFVHTSSGYYMSTPGASRKISFKLDNKLYPFKQFDLQFNRPDRVFSSIPTFPPELVNHYKRVYTKRIEKMGFDPAHVERQLATLSLPQVTILQKNLLPKKTNLSTIEIQVQAKDQHLLLDRLQIYVNGVPHFGSAGFSLTGKSVKETSQRFKLPLNAGLNRIEVMAMNTSGIESLREKITVECVHPFPAQKIYVISIGVSNYVEANKNLHFAAKDARDIQSVWERHPSPSNRLMPVKSVLLLDKEVTRSNVLNLKKLLLNTTVNDQVILYYAGHGLLNQQLDYYLATHDVSFANPSVNGILYSELEDLLDGIPARQKVLLIDACHAGEVDKEEVKLQEQSKKTKEVIQFVRNGDLFLQNKRAISYFDLMKEFFVDLRTHHGANIFSSSGAKEFALEGDEWNNGVFTYHLIQALKEQKADSNKDKKIHLSELIRYVSEEVRKMTKGQQVPTPRVLNLDQDLLIWEEPFE